MGRQRSEIEQEIDVRSANVYAGFFLRQLQPDMLVLDCGCGTATSTIGLAEALPAGTVIGIDLAKDSLAAARRYGSVMGRQNLFCAAADRRRLPFPEAAFDAVLCHSVLGYPTVATGPSSSRAASGRSRTSRMSRR